MLCDARWKPVAKRETTFFHCDARLRHYSVLANVALRLFRFILQRAERRHAAVAINPQKREIADSIDDDGQPCGGEHVGDDEYDAERDDFQSSGRMTCIQSVFHQKLREQRTAGYNAGKEYRQHR